MNYLLVQNKQTVLLGPVFWRQRFIQSEINDLVENEELTINYQVPATEQGYIDIGDGFEIFPVELTTPNYDPIYQSLAGPVWAYLDNVATGTYTVNDLDIEIVKSNLKVIAAAERYRKQNLGTDVTVTGATFTVGTSADILNQFVTLVASVGTDTINYKSPNGFISLTGPDFQIIVDAINSYIQLQFTWEMAIVQSINDALDADSLKAITIVEPVQDKLIKNA